MSTSTALTTLNFGLATLWDYFITTLTSGGVLAFIISIAVLFVALRWGKRLLHSKV